MLPENETTRDSCKKWKRVLERMRNRNPRRKDRKYKPQKVNVLE